jgi:hypothetical protein
VRVFELAIIVVVILLVVSIVGGLLLQYVVEFWARRMKDKPVDAPYWACCIASVFIGWNVVPIAAVVTWIFDKADSD